MTTKIYYFTGTGNSLSVAKHIAENLDNCELIRIKNQKTVIDCENFGIAFPVYAFGPPKIVIDFINKIEIKSNPYIFAVPTYAGLEGSTISMVNKLLKKQGFRINLGIPVIMPTNYMNSPKKYDQVKVDNCLNKAKGKCLEISEKITNKEDFIKKPNFFLSLLTYPVGKLFPRVVNKQDTKFKVLENCTSCGICVKVCPVNNIKLDNNGNPIWQHKCQQCMACIQYCPEKAIKMSDRKKIQIQYQNPDISIKDLFSDD